MADLLVRLYDLPPGGPAVEGLASQGIVVRRAMASERSIVVEWARVQGSAGWAGECEAAFARQPLACFIAVAGEELCGFACYEATCRNFFGPELVHPDRRGRGVGRALLLAALHAMRAEGYAYARSSAGPPPSISTAGSWARRRSKAPAPGSTRCRRCRSSRSGEF